MVNCNIFCIGDFLFLKKNYAPQSLFGRLCKWARILREPSLLFISFSLYQQFKILHTLLHTADLLSIVYFSFIQNSQQ
jgi:hypothetical protein